MDTTGGYLRIADTLKPDAIEAIRALRRLDVSNTVMLSGDTEAAAREVASTLGFSTYKAELLLEGRVATLEDLLRQSDGGCTAFVGDCINDAPALARADVVLAMGALGSDAAIETADVVIMTDAPPPKAAGA